MSTDSTRVIVGSDVSKQWVDFFVLHGKAERRGRRPRRVRELIALVAELARWEPQLVVLEASGGLETAVWAAREAAGLRVAVVNPKRVRDFARSLGLLAKTDRLDARVLALFGERLRPAATRLPSRQLWELRELLRHLDALVGLRATQLRTAPGIGPKTCWALLADLPELGQLSARPRVRKALYMAARTAVRCDPHLAAFRSRLLAVGKPKQVALIAVARKLLVARNAMIRDDRPWFPLPA